MRKIRHLPPGKPDDFSINQQELLTQTFGPISAVIATIGFFITGLSLFVGGIGIMNIMFVSVTERTKEIGIRKAIGAKRRTILLQFLVEAAALCLIGGSDRPFARLPAQPDRGSGPPDRHAVLGRVCRHRHFPAGRCRVGIPSRVSCRENGSRGGAAL